MFVYKEEEEEKEAEGERRGAHVWPINRCWKAPSLWIWPSIPPELCPRSSEFASFLSFHSYIMVGMAWTMVDASVVKAPAALLGFRKLGFGFGAAAGGCVCKMGRGIGCWHVGSVCWPC